MEALKNTLEEKKMDKKNNKIFNTFIINTYTIVYHD